MWSDENETFKLILSRHDPLNLQVNWRHHMKIAIMITCLNIEYSLSNRNFRFLRSSLAMKVRRHSKQQRKKKHINRKLSTNKHSTFPYVRDYTIILFTFETHKQLNYYYNFLFGFPYAEILIIQEEHHFMTAPTALWLFAVAKVVV